MRANGDGDSTLKVIDLYAVTAPIKQIISTGGTTRIDEMALTSDAKLLLTANNAEDPPFATLFRANGDSAVSNVTKIIKISVDPTIIPAGFGLSVEQPAWDPTTERFYTSIPIIANNPPGCNFGQRTGPITCHGGMLVTDPLNPTAVEGAFDPTTNTGVVPLPACGPNGATVGPNDNLLLGCSPGNSPSDTQTLVINAKTKQSVSTNGITGSDEVFFNRGDNRYYLGASKALGGSVRRVVRLFLAEAIILGITGGIVGSAVGLLLSIWLGKAVFGVAAEPRWIVYPFAVGLTILVSIASAFPLRRLASIRPASVFRGEG